MKILVLQLGRQDDIYISWPTLRGLRRLHQEAEIHLMIQAENQEAVVGLDVVNRIIELQPSSSIDNFDNEKYDHIINLSFTKQSSVFTQGLTGEKTFVTGFSRHADDTLNPVDDTSAYYYAQGGHTNRYHLTEVYAAIAQVELQQEDWLAPVEMQLPRASKELEITLANIPQPWIAVSVTTPSDMWQKVLQQIESLTAFSVLLVGSASDKADAERLLQDGQLKRTYNLVDRTQLCDLFRILKDSSMLISSESVVQHMAALTQTPCVTFVQAHQNFWETGPRAPNSRVVFNPDNIINEVRAVMGFASESALEIRSVSGQPVCFDVVGVNMQTFEWQLTEALYTKTPYPAIRDELYVNAIRRLQEIALGALEQIAFIEERRGDSEVHVGILNELETLVTAVGQMTPIWQPLLNWFVCEKIRIEPGSLQQIIQHTREIYRQLLFVTEIYCPLPQPKERISDANSMVP